MKFNYEGFRMLCQAPCEELLAWLKGQLVAVYGDNNVYESGNRWLFLKGESPACLCAHLDTVHKELIREMYIESKKLTIHSPQGIGGDDRCGVWIILKTISNSIKENKPLPSIFFSTDEETGSNSTRIACKYLLDNYPAVMDDVRFFVQLDRRNTEDSVYYNCENKEFETFINEHGFKTALGSRTDICILCEEWDKAGVNLSCGFEGEHHVTEYVNIRTMLNTTSKLEKILEDANPEQVFSYVPKIKTYNGYSGDNYYHGSEYTGYTVK